MPLSPALEALTARVRACYACERMDHCHVLSETNGPVTARVLFVGEAPGRRGAGRSGVPFSGDESGRRFESLLALAGLRRDDVFITNAVLCNPLDAAGRNRRPSAREVATCLSYLRATIDAIDPAVVVALGGVALDALARIEPHGVLLRSASGVAVPWYGRTLVPLYHPARRAIVHRSESLQADDWRALARLVAAPSVDRAEAAG